MRTITLNKLSLSNWRGQTKEIRLSKNTEITGRNKSGKSSIFNAFLWLLLGVDDADRANYRLFDDTVEQTHENAKPASVEAEIDIDGNISTLKKTATQGWVQKRGSSEYERKGSDNYKFFIDGIEKGASDYKTFIEEMIAPIDKLKIMLNIRYFLSLDWKVMRKHLEAMVGKLSLSDFKGDYTKIKSDLVKYKPEEIKTKYTAQLKAVKQSIDALPTTIAALQSNLPDVSTLPEIAKEIEAHKAEISEIDAKMLGMSNDIQKYIDKRNAEIKHIGELKRRFEEAKAEYNLTPIQQANEIKTKIANLVAENAQIERFNAEGIKSIADAENSLKTLSVNVKILNERRDKLRTENNRLKNLEFAASETFCPFCSQPLPEDMIEKKRSEFVKKREEQRQMVVQDGKQLKSQIEAMEAEIDKLKEKIKAGFTPKPLLDKTELDKQLADMKKNFVKFENTDKGKQMLAEIASLENNLTEIPTATQTNDELSARKKYLLDEIMQKSKMFEREDELKRMNEKIASLQQELKDNAVEKARLEGMIDKVKEFEREKASIVSDRVNERFSYVAIQMQELNKSGEYIDTCIVNDSEGVNALVTNTASRVLCGIDIAMAFQQLYDLKLPLFVDNAEGINEANFPELDTQVVKLIVGEGMFNVECE